MALPARSATSARSGPSAAATLSPTAPPAAPAAWVDGGLWQRCADDAFEATKEAEDVIFKYLTQRDALMCADPV